jgi:hypothetical protein
VSVYGLDERAIEFRYPAEARDLPLASVSRPALRPTQAPVQGVPASFPRGKARPRLDADRSPTSSADVVNEEELYLLSLSCASIGVLLDSFDFDVLVL